MDTDSFIVYIEAKEIDRLLPKETIMRFKKRLKLIAI